MNDDDRQRINRNNHILAEKWQPARVFQFFADIAAIPRGSGNVTAVADYLEAFAQKKRLEYARDAVGNVIIRKKGRPCKCAGVILQAHQDMVCVKTAEKDHNFATDPVEFLDKNDGWLRASETTLGADDGIGVALALALLDDDSLELPPLEGLFTVDEETDMKGAKAVQAASLKGDTLINLDAEDLHIAYVSSAAGVAFQVRLPLQAASGTPGTIMRQVAVNDLLGGHSGIEIHKARANAYVLLARFLNEAAKTIEFSLHTFSQAEGHGADNAIPDRAVAQLSFASERDAESLAHLAETWTQQLQNEYRSSDPDVNLTVSALVGTPDGPAIDAASRRTLLDMICLFPLGVWRFIQSGSLLDTRYGALLVESSCNLGIVRAGNDQAVLSFLARGSTASVLTDLMSRAEALARMAGATLTVSNRTSGWEMPEHPSPIQQLFEGQGVTLLGIHAGLECGCLVEAFAKDGRKLDAVSVGPDLKDVHSPNERLHIESVSVLWKQLLTVLSKL